MNRSIETRLKRLEEQTFPETPPKVNWIFMPLEADADTKRGWHDMFRRIAEERGHKPGWVYDQYLDKFGEAPPSDG
jgi:hypothetical protein